MPCQIARRTRVDPPMEGPLHVISHIGDWVDAIAALPVHGPFPERLVIVPNPRVAHALRRELLRAGRADLLRGTHFSSTTALAEEVLRRRGKVFTPGEGPLRAARIGTLLAAGITLSYFDLDLLRTARGWDEAFAQSISDLEATGLTPDALPTGGPWEDVKTIFEAINASAGTSFSSARILIEAALLLEAPGPAPVLRGPALAVITGHETAVEARFLRALPAVVFAVRTARPLYEAHLARLTALFGEGPARALESDAAPDPELEPNAALTERELLKAYFLTPPERVASAKRPRSAGDDGTFALALHSGVDEEVEAAVRWVTAQIRDHHTPLEEIAILAPTLDPWASLLSTRLSSLPHGDGAIPVFVAGGLPCTDDVGGARLLALLDALAKFLPLGAFARLLPLMRVPDDARRPTHGRALELASSLGTAGGSPADPSGALAWLPRSRARLEAIASSLDGTPAMEGDHRRRKDTRLHDALMAVLPAVEFLHTVAELVVADRPLSDIWPALRIFADAHVHLSAEAPAILLALDAALAPHMGDPSLGEPHGLFALRRIEGELSGLRRSEARFGEPAVYLGTVSGATGLPFHAVRVVGLTEGTLPSIPREDAVLPDALRRAASPLLSVTDGRVRQEVQGLAHVVAETRERIVFSAPRFGVQGSEREASSVCLEAAAAVGRGADPSDPSSFVPSRSALIRDYFAPEREKATADAHRSPTTESAWAAAVAAGATDLPARWRASPQIAPSRISKSEAMSERALVSALAAAIPDSDLPGLTATRPISASRLQRLLQCPRSFFFHSLLRLREPTEAPPLRELPANVYGSLLHDSAETFMRAHGEELEARDRDLDAWTEIAIAMGHAHLDDLLTSYPLAGERARDQQAERLARDLAQLLHIEWHAPGARRFVAVEHPFGYDPPLSITTGDRELHVRGRIDRIDVEARESQMTDDGVALVRDLKSSKAKAREGALEAPDPLIDLQLGLYAKVARALGDDLDLPEVLAVSYVYPASPAQPERAFRGDDFDRLDAAADDWLRVAGDLLEARAFPQTAEASDCTYCAFGAVCGPTAQADARASYAGAGPATQAYAALRFGHDPDDPRDDENGEGRR